MPAAVATPSCLAIASAVASAVSCISVRSALTWARSIAPQMSTPITGAATPKMTAVPPRMSRESLCSRVRRRRIAASGRLDLAGRARLQALHRLVGGPGEGDRVGAQGGVLGQRFGDEPRALGGELVQ